MPAQRSLIRGSAVLVLGVTALYSNAQEIVPLTVILEERTFTAGAAKDRRTYTFVRRTDGSVVESRIDTLADRRQVRSRFIYDLGRQIRISVNDLTKTTTTYPDSGARFTELYKAAKTDCTSAPNPPTDTVLGHRIVKAVERQGEAASHEVHRSERWVAPHLSCAELKRVLSRVKPDGTTEILTLVQATSVQIGDPDPSWFAVRSDYVERKPSDAMQELRKYIPGLLYPAQESVMRLDDAYSSSNANATRIRRP